MADFEALESSIGVPAFILQRAAAARANADGKTDDQVIAEWTGGAAPAPAAAVPASPPAAETAAIASEPEVAAAQAAGGLPAAESLAGDALIAAAAEAKGIPLALVERSAQARADADGVPVEQVMRGWVVEAGLAGAGAAAAPATAAAPPPVERAAPAPPAETAAPAAPVAAAPEPEVEVLEPVAGVEETAEEIPPVPAGRYPAWLAAALVVIPVLAVLYVVVVPNHPSCGSAGQVGVDPATGAHANCDGSVPYGAMKETPVVLGGELFAANCAVCHGANGEGGAGPAMAGGAELQTFPGGACDSHQQWVTLGSAGWPDETYGAQDKPVGGSGSLMPGFGGTLSEEQIAQVVLYERVAFGLEDQTGAEEECGFTSAGEYVGLASG
jgi:mono/diheme cytochrome c family protein